MVIISLDIILPDRDIIILSRIERAKPITKVMFERIVKLIKNIGQL